MTSWIPPVTVKNDLERRLAESFLMFDFIGDQTVEPEHIGTILRFLGCVPSDADITDFIKQTGYYESRIHLSKFLTVLNKWLIEDRMKPASSAELTNTFKLFDSSGNAYCEKNDFLAKFKELGDKLTDEEFHNMTTALNMDQCKSQILYERYIEKILHEPENSIYNEAKEIEVIKQAVESVGTAEIKKPEHHRLPDEKQEFMQSKLSNEKNQKSNLGML